MTRVPEKDIIEKCGYVNDTFQLHYTAVEFENYDFDTIYFIICKGYKCASYPTLLFDCVYFFDNNKKLSASGTDGPSCKGPLTTIKLTKGNKTTIFVEMPDFEISRDSNEIFWGAGCNYVAYNYKIKVDSAGQNLSKNVLVSSGEKNFRNKPLFEGLAGYSFGFR